MGQPREPREARSVAQRRLRAQRDNDARRRPNQSRDLGDGLGGGDEDWNQFRSFLTGALTVGFIWLLNALQQSEPDDIPRDRINSNNNNVIYSFSSLEDESVE